MLTFLIGSAVGILAAAALTFAYHRLRGGLALAALLGTIFLSMLPRLYFAFSGDIDGNVLYSMGWMLFVAGGFFWGYQNGARYFKKNTGKN